MVGTSTLISVDEYLRTSYEPDMDFVDGVLVRRHVGAQRHGRLQTILAADLEKHRKTHEIAVFTAARLRISSTRYRVPDVSVLEIPYTKAREILDVPAIVVEIKSPGDRFDEILDRCFDFEKLTVPNII